MLNKYNAAWEKTEHGLAKSTRLAANMTRALLELERLLTDLAQTGALRALGEEATGRPASLMTARPARSRRGRYRKP